MAAKPPVVLMLLIAPERLRPWEPKNNTLLMVPSPPVPPELFFLHSLLSSSPSCSPVNESVAALRLRDRKKAGGLNLAGGTAAPVCSGPIKTSQSSRREEGRERRGATGRGERPLGEEEMRSDNWQQTDDWKRESQL